MLDLTLSFSFSFSNNSFRILRSIFNVGLLHFKILIIEYWKKINVQQMVLVIQVFSKEIVNILLLKSKFHLRQFTQVDLKQASSIYCILFSVWISVLKCNLFDCFLTGKKLTFGFSFTTL